MAADPGTTPTGTIPLQNMSLTQAQNTVLGQGASLMASPYQTYTGPTVAALTPDQLNAQQMARNTAAGAAGTNPAAIQGNIDYGLSGFDPNQVQQFMSPYTSGVVNEIGRLGTQNLMQNVIPGVNSTFTGAGQFGSTRNGDFLNQAIQNQDYNTLGQQSNALQAAATQGLNAYTQWHQNALPNAAAAANMGMGAANALNASGTQQQQQTQQNLTAGQTEFNNQNQYPQQQLGWYANLVNGVNGTPGTVQTSTPNQLPPSPLIQGLGTAASLYGSFIK